MLKEEVDKIFKENPVKPSILDNSWYPSRRDIKNHIYKTTWLKKLSQIDQVNLDELVSQWKKDDPSRSFFFRKATKPEEEEAECNEEEEEEEVDTDEDEGDEDDDSTAGPRFTPLKKITEEDMAKKKNSFLFVHQEKWQRDLLQRCGKDIFLLDATYKTTKYNLKKKEEEKHKRTR